MIFEHGKDAKIFENVVLPKDTALVLAAIVNSKDLFISISNNNKEEIHMCRQLELLKEDGIREGRKAGEKETLVNNMKKIMNKLNYTIEQAMDFLEIPANQRDEIKSLLTHN